MTNHFGMSVAEVSACIGDIAQADEHICTTHSSVSMTIDINATRIDMDWFLYQLLTLPLVQQSPQTSPSATSMIVIMQFIDVHIDSLAIAHKPRNILWSAYGDCPIIGNPAASS
jgi:hypothetical protein